MKKRNYGNIVATICIILGIQMLCLVDVHYVFGIISATFFYVADYYACK